MTGARTTTPTDRISRLATSRRPRSLVGGWTTRIESHNRWTNERGPVTEKRSFEGAWAGIRVAITSHVADGSFA